MRITTEEIFALSLLAPLLRELHERHPDIMIELDTGQEMRDLGAGEADIALAQQLNEQPAGFVGRRLGVDDWTLYCSRDYAARHGAPSPSGTLRSILLSAAGAAICGATIRPG